MRKILLVVFAAACVAPHHVAAQSTSGSIYGAVTDETGAVIPKVTVTAREVKTGITRTTVANGSGEYTFPTLEPGDYEVSTSAAGFKGQTQTGVSVSANQNVHVTFALPPGSSSETVEVTALTTMVDTRESQLGETIDQHHIEDLPTLNRDPYTLVTTIPGVTNFNGDSAIGTRAGVNFSVNGLTSDMISYYLDGAYNDAFFQNGGNAVPNPDALDQARILTSNFDAEFGRSPGGVANFITKSGNNQFHGSVYDYLRNDVFNSRNYFLTTVSPLKQNQFGGTVGGPIAHDRLFFFLAYQGLILHTNQTVNSTAITTATALERTGDFSLSKVKPVLPAGTNCGTTSAPKICGPSMDAVALKLLQYVPVEDASGTFTSQQGAPANSNANQGLARLDFHAFTSHDIEAMFFTSRGTNQTPVVGGNQIIGYSGMSNYENQDNVVLRDTWTLSPRTLNTFRAFYTQNRYIIANLHTDQTFASLGSKAVEGGPSFAVPRFVINGYWIMGTSGAGPSDISQLQFGGVETMNMDRGHHSMKFGGAYVAQKYTESGGLNAGGTFTFTATNVTKNALADFLLGKANTLVQTNSVKHRTHTYDPSLFFQDDWQVNHRVNLNLGVRWEMFPPFLGDPAVGTLIPGEQSQVIPQAPLGLVYPGDPGVPAGVYDTSLRRIAPRVGFAWDVRGNGATGLRGGFGIFYFFQNETLTGNITQQPFSLSLTTNKTPSLVDPYNTLNGGTDPFPFVYDPSHPNFVTNATIPAVPVGGGTTPYVEEYNLTLEQQLTPQLAFRIGYVGNASRKLYIQHDVNAPAYFPGAATSTAGLNCRRPYEPYRSGGPVNSATCAFPGLNGQYSGYAYSAINEYDPANNGSYNSLQTTLRGRFKNANFLVFYVWSKDLNYQAPFVDGSDIRKNYGRADNDVRSNFVASYTFRLPSVKEWGFVGRQALSGWSLNGITTLQSGSPFTVISGQDSNLDNTVNDRPNLVGNPYSNASTRAQKIAGYLNPAAFVAPSGPYGTEQRNSLTGPGVVRTDLSLFKAFPIWREARLQFRAEAFNVFRNVNLNIANNVNLPNINMTAANFGHITTEGTGRILQFALKIDF